MDCQGRIGILLVEHNPGDVVLFCEGLKNCGLRTDLRVAVDGECALKFLFEGGFRPDIIILELNLPHVDGYEVLRRVKGSALSDIPVIVFSSSASGAEAESAAAHIQKPANPDEYLETVREISNHWLASLGKPADDFLFCA